MDSPAAKPAESIPEWTPPIGDRRRHVRQKVHAPAYASLNTNSSGMVLDLNEVLDISEDGMSIQTATPPELNSSLNLSLDLSETKSFIHTTGQVVWSDRSGRAGVRFPNMPYASVRQLKEWLFLNALTACSNHFASQGLHARVEVPSPMPAPQPVLEESPLAPTSPDYTAMLSALAAVQREVESFGTDIESALRLIADRALAFTRATGSAIALQEESEMICRASAGGAPPVGARLQVGSGFSGECVRAGRLLRCDDSETDSRVDQESCRALGIRSMIAIPIRANGGVVGLLEVFSPNAGAFTDNDNIIVRRLAETTASAVRRVQAPMHATAPPATAKELFVTEESAGLHSPRFRRVLAAITLFAVAAVLAWILFPRLRSRADAQVLQPAPAKPQAVARPAGSSSGALDFDGMRRLAEQGDPAAQFAVGAHYVTGEGVTQNYSEAVQWFSKAAGQGHVTAQSTLGVYYGIGRGVPQDFSKAYFWSILAQAGGDEASKYRIPLLVSHLSRGQIVEIQKQANDWLKEHNLASSKPSPER